MVPHIVHFRVPGMKSEVLLHALEKDGFCVSSQSACAAGDEKPSRVLLAMGLSEAEAASGIRVSLSPEHTKADIERLSDAVLRNVGQLWQWMR